ncbi:MAG: hypothetical protein JRN28_00680 [Nitrososphaerota archaeon]|nr:hypothetical protein [Nitrososphaerota archaeon]
MQRLLGSARLSDATKKGYLGRIQQYLREAQMTPDELVAAARSHPREFEERFIGFIQETGKSSTSTTTAFRDSVKKFLEINRVEEVKWGYVNEFVPGAKKAGQDRAPTLEEVRRVVDVADLRMKCLVLFLCSSGSRIGSVQWLRWKDVEEVEIGGEKFAKLTIYRGELRGVGITISKRSVSRILKSLVEKGFLTMVGNGYEPTDLARARPKQGTL